jgi:hypothetical protein
MASAGRSITLAGFRSIISRDIGNGTIVITGRVDQCVVELSRLAHGLQFSVPGALLLVVDQS